MGDVDAGSAGKKDDARTARRLGFAILVAAAAALLLWSLWPRFAAVPNVVGLSEEQGRAAIEKAGLKIGIVGTRTVEGTSAGRIVGQLPPPGMQVTRGAVVDYTIAEASAAGAGAEASVGAVLGSNNASGVLVPDVVGKTQAEARRSLALLGLEVTAAYTNSGMAVGEVIHQAPTGGVVVAAGTPIELTVSSGAGLTGAAAVGWDGPIVPEVLGLTASSARSKLAAAGYGIKLVYSPSTSAPRGLCFWQSSGPGPEAHPPSTVEVWVSTGPPTRGQPYPMPPDVSPAYSTW